MTNDYLNDKYVETMNEVFRAIRNFHDENLRHTHEDVSAHHRKYNIFGREEEEA